MISSIISLFITYLLTTTQYYSVNKGDWNLAATYWANMRKKGKQFSDIDLLLAAMCANKNGTLVTSDNDFNALNITLENWRTLPILK